MRGSVNEFVSEEKMRKPIIAANWKMHKTLEEADVFIENLKLLLKDETTVEVVVCPSFTALAPVSRLLSGTNIALGAQNMYHEKQGAFTGEISPAQVRDAGCAYVILGHSERRQYFFEKDEALAKKLAAAFAEGLKPILCVGETLSHREKNETLSVIHGQLHGALDGLKNMPPSTLKTLVIAYEPVWAIGTGKNASAQDAQDVSSSIRSALQKLFGREVSDAVRIQYGGSVKPENIKELMQKADVDGALVGGASLVAETFAKLVQYYG